MEIKGWHFCIRGLSMESLLMGFYNVTNFYCYTLQWRHSDHDGVSNHQPRGCLLNRLFKRRSKKTSKLRRTGLCVGNSPGPVNSPHKGPVTRKMFPFDDVIMRILLMMNKSHLSYGYYHMNRGSHQCYTVGLNFDSDLLQPYVLQMSLSKRNTTFTRLLCFVYKTESVVTS